MFERYTEKARRVIFFARYEASQLNSDHIEPEHLLLGLMREDKTLTIQLLRSTSVIESVRARIEAERGSARIVYSVDLPLSQSAKRVLAYSAQEAERLDHKNVGTAHLLLGMLDERDSLAARLLSEHHVTPEAVRAYAIAQSSGTSVFQSVPALPAPAPRALLEFLGEREKAGDISVFADVTLGGETVDIAVYEGKAVVTDGHSLAESDDEQTLTQLWKRINAIVKEMEHAIGQHEFEKARQLSREENEAREAWRQLRERLPEEGALNKQSDSLPFLCILLLRRESFSQVRARIDASLKAGVAQVWLLDEADRKAYTATSKDGWREHMGDVLRVEQPRLEIGRSEIFGESN